MSLSSEKTLDVTKLSPPLPKCLFAVIAAPCERNPVCLGVRSERTIHGVGHWRGWRGKDVKEVTMVWEDVRRRWGVGEDEERENSQK